MKLRLCFIACLAAHIAIASDDYLTWEPFDSSSELSDLVVGENADIIVGGASGNTYYDVDRVSGLPSGLSFDNSSFCLQDGACTLGLDMIKGTPTKVGTYSVTFYATKYKGGATIKQVTRKVKVLTDVGQIIYSGNGGRGSMSAKSVSCYSTYTFPSCTYTRSGYRFSGWQISGCCIPYDGTTYSPGDTLNLQEYMDPHYSETMSLYVSAIWSQIPSWPTSYRTSFSASDLRIKENQDGSYSDCVVMDPGGASGSQRLYENMSYDDYPLPDCPYSRTGYRFAGWNFYNPCRASGASSFSCKGINCGVLEGVYQPGELVNVCGVCAIEAVWEAVPFTVYFNANGGSCSSTSKSVTPGSTYGSLPTPTRTGYSFAGWYTSSSGGTQITSTSSLDSNASHTLYAHWTANTYRISYNSNGGSGTMMRTTMTYDSGSQLAACAFTRQGYRFCGWAKSADGASVYANGQSVKNLTTSNNGVVKLYAVWQPAGIAVNYFRQRYPWNGLVDLEIVVTGDVGTSYPATIQAVDGNGLSLTVSTIGLGALKTGGNPVTLTNGTNHVVWDAQTDLGVGYTCDAVRMRATLITEEVDSFDSEWSAAGSLDLSIGTRRASDTQAIAFGSDWFDGGSRAVVTVEGVTLAEKTGSGTVPWSGSTTTQYTLTHQVFNELGVQVGETYTATFQWVNRRSVTFKGNLAGVVDQTRKYDEGYAYETLPMVSTPGYDFLGWWTLPAGGTQVATTDVAETDATFYAHWLPHEYTVRFDANGGEGEMGEMSFVYGESQTLPTNSFVLEGYTFRGWRKKGESGSGVFRDGSVVSNLTVEAGGIVTLMAYWKVIRGTVIDEVVPVTISDGATFVATTYNGYLFREEDGIVVGTIQVKAAAGKMNKKTGATTSKLTVSVQLAESTKKVSISGEYDLVAGGEQTFSAKTGQSITLLLGTNGLTGRYGAYEIEGVPNVYSAKDAASKAAASAADAAYVGTYNLIADEGTFTVTVAKKGKVKVSGTTAAGKKVSVSTQLIVGEDDACAPVVVPKTGLSFAVWFEMDGASVTCSVDSLTNAILGKPGTLGGGATFTLDADTLADLIGDETYIDYFPSSVPVAQSGTKWIVAEGAKAGKVVLTKTGEVDEAKAGANPSALKLTYTAKTGAFKGSFKVYVNVRGKPSALSATVSGVMIDGCGYGTATIKKYGTIEIEIR